MFFPIQWYIGYMVMFQTLQDSFLCMPKEEKKEQV